MARLFVHHTVDDYGAWRKAYDDFDAERGPMGVKGSAVFRSVDDPNEVTVWHDFDTIGEAKAFVGSEALKEAMRKAGVRGEPQIWIAEQD